MLMSRPAHRQTHRRKCESRAVFCWGRIRNTCFGFSKKQSKGKVKSQDLVVCLLAPAYFTFFCRLTELNAHAPHLIASWLLWNPPAVHLNRLSDLIQVCDHTPHHITPNLLFPFDDPLGCCSIHPKSESPRSPDSAKFFWDFPPNSRLRTWNP